MIQANLEQVGKIQLYVLKCPRYAIPTLCGHVSRELSTTFLILPQSPFISKRAVFLYIHISQR